MVKRDLVPLEERFDRSDVLRDTVRRQALDKDASVALPLDARIEQHEYAAVFERTNETAKALFERDDGRGYLIFEEGIAAAVFDRAHARLHHWVSRNGKRQAVNDHAAQRFSLHVDALPETRRAEENGIWSLPKLLKQRLARSRALQQQGVAHFDQQALVQVVHLLIAGEEAEGAAMRDVEHAADALRSLLLKIRVARVGHIRRQIEQRLLAVAEMRGHDQFARVIHAKALADVCETALHGERGRGEHDAGKI